MDKEEVIKSLHNLKIELSKQYGIKNLYLFGSYSTNQQNIYSDIDVALSGICIFSLEHFRFYKFFNRAGCFC